MPVTVSCSALQFGPPLLTWYMAALNVQYEKAERFVKRSALPPLSVSDRDSFDSLALSCGRFARKVVWWFVWHAAHAGGAIKIK